MLLEVPAHLLEAADLAVDEVVGQVHEEWLVADGAFRAQHGVAEAERDPLPHEDAGRRGRDDVANEAEQLRLAGLDQLPLELGIGVEMVLDSAFRRAGDKHEALGACSERLFHRVLNQRLVDDRQHLLRRCLRGR